MSWRSRRQAAEDLLLAFYAEAQHRGFSAGEYPVPKVLAGPDAATEIATVECDVVLNAITGSMDFGRRSRRSGGAKARARQQGVADRRRTAGRGSSAARADRPRRLGAFALAQCLRGGRRDEVSRLILTASGGPFRGRPRETLGDITPEQALTHPTWDMGPSP